MEIQAKLYGSLRRFSSPDTPGVWLGELPSHATLQTLIQQIGMPEQEIWIAAINGKACPFETEIPEGANVIFVTARGSGG